MTENLEIISVVLKGRGNWNLFKHIFRYPKNLQNGDTFHLDLHVKMKDGKLIPGRKES